MRDAQISETIAPTPLETERDRTTGFPSGGDIDRADALSLGQNDLTQSRTGKACYAYVIGASRDGPVKVGVGAKPWERVADLQTGHPAKLNCYLIEAIPNGMIIERLAHQILEP